MAILFRHFLRLLRGYPYAASVSSLLVFQSVSALGQTAECPAVAEHTPSSVDTVYSQGRYKQAEDLYGQDLAQHPHDLKLSAALVRTWLHEGEVSQAAAQVSKTLADDPHSAITLTALAEVQVHQGQPWLALETLKEATAADPCYARIHYVRSRALRLDSMYASERTEIQDAYDIDPTDPDIRHAWLSTVSPAREIEGIASSLKTMKNIDEDTRNKAEESIRSMMPLLSENNQTCEVLPTADSATLPLQPSFLDAKTIAGYRLDVQFPQSKAKLQVDTAASGMFISRALADQNGFEHAAGAPPGTVHVDSVHIGPLEFHDCTVGVSETPFAGKSDGFIGTDMFASYLITLDHPGGKLTLAPLPKQATLLPGDRDVPPELRDFSPAYHRMQYLLVPVLLDNKTRKLFVLDSGIRLSTMTSEVAHAVSTTKVNFTNPVQTVSGSTLQVYRDSFDFQFANQALNHQAHILQMDPLAIDQNAGFEVAGMLGFDMLHSLTMHLDYRDGLVKFESAETGTSPGHAAGTMTASGSHGSKEVDCETGDDQDRPLNTTLEAKITGLLDTAHLKPGKQVTVAMAYGWRDAECELSIGSMLYGHVTAVASLKSPDSSELSLVFDHADCYGHEKRPLSLRVVGLVAAPDQYVGVHSALPSQLSGGGRNLSVTARSEGLAAADENMNPGGPPHTIHPGFVAGIPKLKLQPLGGPGCSTKLVSTQSSLRLGPGTELIFTRQAAR